MGVGRPGTPIPRWEKMTWFGSADVAEAGVALQVDMT